MFTIEKIHAKLKLIHGGNHATSTRKFRTRN